MCLNDDRSGEKGLIIMCEMFWLSTFHLEKKGLCNIYKNREME